jgi:hypothetical protein
LLTDELVEFRDKGSLPFIEQLFKEKLIDESIITLDEVYDEYEGKYDYFFNEDMINSLCILKEIVFIKDQILVVILVT